ncbi:hypothetical protein acdb102_22310 [Acidothermaceae bacterium B102]|nr:hypothetical protein acdb102_22310 [Acidothermaceae bacterium B102]
MEKTNQPAIGEVLKRLRLERGWSLRELERQSDGSLRSGHMSQIEAGKVGEPSLSVLREFAKTVGVEFQTLMGLLYPDDRQDSADEEQQAMVLAYFSHLTPAQTTAALNYLKWMTTAAGAAGWS